MQPRAAPCRGVKLSKTHPVVVGGMVEPRRAAPLGKRPHEALQPAALADELECALCLRLLHRPVALPCGHVHCRGCTASALRSARRCPACRAPAFLADPPAAPVVVPLDKLLRAAFPAEQAARDEEESCEAAEGERAAAGRAAGEPPLSLPLFVVDAVVPGQMLRLHVFEPRYRALVSAALAGDRKFGVVGPPRREDARHFDGVPPPFARHGCLVEITEATPMPDGRFLLAAVARRRFAVERHAVAPAGFFVAAAGEPDDGEGKAALQVEASASEVEVATGAEEPPAEQAEHEHTQRGAQQPAAGGDDPLTGSPAVYVKALCGQTRKTLALLDEWLEIVGKGRVGLLSSNFGSTQALLDACGVRPPLPEEGDSAAVARQRAERLSWWVTSVVNPLPVLGAASEVRPAALAAPGPLQRLHCLEECIAQAIPYCKQSALRREQWLNFLERVRGVTTAVASFFSRRR